MAWTTILGFAVIVGVFLYAGEIARQIARGCQRLRSEARILPARRRRARGGHPTSPRVLTSWRRFGLLQDRARWDDEFTARVKRELHR